jgi:hypothetical protein
MVRHDVTGWFARSGLLLLIVGGVLLRHGIRRDDDSESTEINEAQTTFLLVLLRRSPAGLNSVELEAIVRAAWQRRFGPNHDGSHFVESGDEGIGFVIQAYGNAFMVIQTQKGVRDLKPPIRLHPETAANIWDHYCHDLSVGVVYNCNNDTTKLSLLVGSLAAALVDADTLGILHPYSGQLWALDRDTINRLKENSEEFFGFEQAV